MDNLRRAQLTEALKKVSGLAQLYKSDLFQHDFIPHLTALSTVQFIDPATFKTREEYEFALDKANIKAGAYRELLTFFSGLDARIAEINRQLDVLNAKNDAKDK